MRQPTSHEEREEREEREEALGALGHLAKEAFSDSVKAPVAAHGKRALKAAIAADRTRRSRPWVALAAAAVLATVALFAVRYYPGTLAYQVDSQAPSDGGYIQGSKQRPAMARFTDGTEVRVAEGARARIVDVDRRGARVALEQGRAALHVVHRPEARWSVDAGPFSIAVTGTEFDVEWSPSEGVLVVELRRGGVIVRGPLAVDGIGVHTGQRLVASLSDGRLHIEPLDVPRVVAAANPAPVATAEGKPVAGASPAVDPEPVPRSLEHVDRAPAGWQKRVASGDFRSVIADALGKGLGSTLSQAPLGDLVALADAARYTGNSNLARETLASQRKRFPASTDARTAAFFLGRLAEDRGATGEAIDWYERYLSEAPHGAFAAEALGREMLATRRARGPAAATVIARRYLDRFPRGPYATSAQKLAPEP